MRTGRDVRGCLLCAYLDGRMGLEGGALRCVCEGGLCACGREMVSFRCSEDGDGDGNERASGAAGIGKSMRWTKRSCASAHARARAVF